MAVLLDGDSNRDRSRVHPSLRLDARPFRTRTATATRAKPQPCRHVQPALTGVSVAGGVAAPIERLMDECEDDFREAVFCVPAEGETDGVGGQKDLLKIAGMR